MIYDNVLPTTMYDFMGGNKGHNKDVFQLPHTSSYVPDAESTAALPRVLGNGGIVCPSLA